MISWWTELMKYLLRFLKIGHRQLSMPELEGYSVKRVGMQTRFTHMLPSGLIQVGRMRTEDLLEIPTLRESDIICLLR